LCGKFIMFHFNISYESISRKKRTKIMLIYKLRLISNRSIDYRNQMFFGFIKRIVAYNIKSFEMISKEYFKIVVMSLMQCCINTMIISTSIGCILYFVIFYKNKIFYYLHLLNLSIFTKKSSNRLFIYIK